jgi:hypothetical protein
MSTEDGSEAGAAGGGEDSDSEESLELEVESNAESENTVSGHINIRDGITKRCK